MCVANCTESCALELRLSARTPQEHHKRARHREREFASLVLLHQGERQVHTRRDTGRGIDGSVLHEDHVPFHAHVGIAPPQLFAVGPVRGGTAALEQAGFGEEVRAGADRRHAPDLAGLPPEPAQDPGIGVVTLGPQSACDQQRVDAAAGLGVATVGEQP